MKHRKFWTLLTAAAALLVLAVFVSADTADVIEVTGTVKLTSDGEIYQLIAGPYPEWRSDTDDVKKLNESGKIKFNADAKEWVIDNLSLVVKPVKVERDNNNRCVALFLDGACRLVFEGENSVTADCSAGEVESIWEYAVYTESAVEILGRGENGKTPVLKLSVKVADDSKEAAYSVCARFYNSVNDITIKSLNLVADNTICSDNGSIKINDCPSVKLGGYIHGSNNVAIDNCKSFEISDCIYAFDDINIKNCPGFKSVCNESVYNGNMHARNINIENCPGFVIEILDGYEAGITAEHGDVTIKNSSGFKINANAEYCRGIYVNSGSCFIDNCPDFVIEADNIAIWIYNGLSIGLMSVDAEESDEEEMLGVSIENSSNFKIDSRQAGILVRNNNYIENIASRVIINKCEGFEINALLGDPVKINGDWLGNASVDIMTCPGFRMTSVNEKDECGGFFAICIQDDDYMEGEYSSVKEDATKKSVVITDSDNFAIEGVGGIGVGMTNIYDERIVMIDNCKNFSVVGYLRPAIESEKYNVNASTGYIELDNEKYSTGVFELAASTYSFSNFDNALITHTGGTVADKEVYVEETTYDGDKMRVEAYMENAEEFGKTEEYAKKVVYTIPEPEPEPETKKSFRLPCLIEIRFETNGGEKLRSALSTPGYSLRLAKYVPEREGYTFTGWYEDKELTKPIKRIVAFENTTIYAGWTTAD